MPEFYSVYHIARQVLTASAYATFEQLVRPHLDALDNTRNEARECGDIDDGDVEFFERAAQAAFDQFASVVLTRLLEKIGYREPRAAEQRTRR